MTDPAPAPPAWERDVLERIALKALDDQRRARQWNALFKLLWFALAFFLLSIWVGWVGRPDRDALSAASATGKFTALVDLEGIIGPDSKASAEKVIKSLNRAFKDGGTQGVVLRINSPGGSPVQAGYINDEIRRLRAKYPSTPLYAVVQDLCASGGYYVAVAADKIYVDKASLVGSIGVIMGGFGFPGTLEKLGMERRVYASGENKDFLDPFLPESPEHRAHAQRMIAEIQQQFVRVVRQGRGARLKESPELYSGLVWTGEKSVELGLADAFGSLEYVAREVIKAERVVDFSPKDNIFEQLADRMGTRFAALVARSLAEAAARAPLEIR